MHRISEALERIHVVVTFAEHGLLPFDESFVDQKSVSAAPCAASAGTSI